MICLFSPRALIGFLLSLTPLSCDLMGWRGAGGNGAASTGDTPFISPSLPLSLPLSPPTPWPKLTKKYQRRLPRLRRPPNDPRIHRRMDHRQHLPLRGVRHLRRLLACLRLHPDPLVQRLWRLRHRSHRGGNEHGKPGQCAGAAAARVLCQFCVFFGVYGVRSLFPLLFLSGFWGAGVVGANGAMVRT